VTQRLRCSRRPKREPPQSAQRATMVIAMRRTFGCAVVIAALTVPALAQDPAAKAAASGMQRKLASILAIAEQSPDTRAPRRLRRTTLTEPEVNAYLSQNGASFMPEGVANPVVTLDAGGRVRAKAMVDLDKALKPKERSWLDPLAWVSGTMEIAALGTLQTSAGKGRLTIEQATLGGVPVPPALLQEVVSAYSKTPERPAGFSLTEPFALPANIWNVETARGQAVVVQ
jgi:hypothetical protein